jgi:Curli production assembly/transport component CsgG
MNRAGRLTRSPALLPMALLVLAALCSACAPPAVVFLNSHYNPQQVQKVALFDFEDYPGMAGSGKIAAGIFEKYLFLSKYSVVDRRQVQATLAELGIQPTDNLDLYAIRSVGAKLGVDALVFGQVTDFTDTTDRTVVEAMTLEQSSPLYSQVETVQAAQGGGLVKTRQDVLTGYAVSSVDQPVQQTETVDAHVGFSLRMVDVHTGELLWSASSSASGSHLDDAAEQVSSQIISALEASIKNSTI